jgi:hypothetical protein
MIDESKGLCEECGSNNVKILARPNSSTPCLEEGFYLAMCLDCRRIVSLGEARGVLLLASHSEGHLIADTYLCPQCGRDVRGFRIGDKCPSCQAEIWTSALWPAASINSVDLSNHMQERDPHSFNRALWIIGMIIVTAIAAIVGRMLQP